MEKNQGELFSLLGGEQEKPTESNRVATERDGFER
jgi:hypothetical protein